MEPHPAQAPVDSDLTLNQWGSAHTFAAMLYSRDNNAMCALQAAQVHLPCAQ